MAWWPTPSYGGPLPDALMTSRKCIWQGLEGVCSESKARFDCSLGAQSASGPRLWRRWSLRGCIRHHRHDSGRGRDDPDRIVRGRRRRALVGQGDLGRHLLLRRRAQGCDRLRRLDRQPGWRFAHQLLGPQLRRDRKAAENPDLDGLVRLCLRHGVQVPRSAESDQRTGCGQGHGHSRR
jgi:hypothetical protein